MGNLDILETETPSAPSDQNNSVMRPNSADSETPASEPEVSIEFAKETEVFSAEQSQTSESESQPNESEEPENTNTIETVDTSKHESEHNDKEGLPSSPNTEMSTSRQDVFTQQEDAPYNIEESDLPLNFAGSPKNDHSDTDESDIDDYDPAEALSESVNGESVKEPSKSETASPIEETKEETEEETKEETKEDTKEVSESNAYNPSDASDDDDYDPESNVITGTPDIPKAAGLPPKPSHLTLSNPKPEVTPDLRQAYEAVMNSEIVQSKEFGELSKEQQMTVIEKLLLEKNIALPSEPYTQSNSPKISRHPTLDQEVTEQEENDYKEYTEGRDAEGPAEGFPDHSRLYVGNLPCNYITEFDLFRIFNKYGQVAGITMKTGFGFVQFFKAEACEEAITKENGAVLCGRVLRLDASRSRRDITPSTKARGRERSAEDADRRSEDESPNKKRRRTTDIKIFTCEETDDDFLSEVEEAFSQKRITFEVISVDISNLADTLQDAAYSGVLGACVIKNNKADLQTFEETDEGIKFDEYEDVELIAMCNMILSAKKQDSVEEEREKFQSPRSDFSSSREENYRSPRNDFSRPRDPRDFRGDYSHNGRDDSKRRFNERRNHRNRYDDARPYNQSYNRPYNQTNPAYSQPYNQSYQNRTSYNQGRSPYSYGQGFQNYNQQQGQGYQNQSQGYQNQSQGYQNPNQGYQNPNQGYHNQSQGYQNPNQGYQHPNQGYQNYANAGYNQFNPNLSAAAQTLQNMDPNTKQSIIALLQNQNAPVAMRQPAQYAGAGAGAPGPAPAAPAPAAPAPAPYAESMGSQASSQVNHLLSQLQDPRAPYSYQTNFQ